MQGSKTRNYVGLFTLPSRGEDISLCCPLVTNQLVAKMCSTICAALW